jgi:hypothetical protein
VKDLSAPLVYLQGGDTVILDVFKPFYDQGATVIDNHTMGLTAVVTGTVNNKVTGWYTLTYTATDSSGNITTAKRYVRVVDRMRPVITLKGSAVIHLKRFQAFVDPGVTITDNYYTQAQLEPLMVTTSTIVTHKEGLYEICYSVKDPSDNQSAEVCRLVSVDAADPNAIDNLSLEDMVNVYPNPNNGLFNIALTADGSNMSIEIYNAHGALVQVIDNGILQSKTYTVDLGTEAPGIYFVRIVSELGTVTKKVSYNK